MSSMWKRVNIIDHALVGRQMVEWTLNPASRPSTMEDFKAQMAGKLEIIDPTKTNKFGGFVDTPLDTIIIRLPPKEMIQQAQATYVNPDYDVLGYPLPAYYGPDVTKLLKGDGMTAEKLFYSRVGDYTTQECE